MHWLESGSARLASGLLISILACSTTTRPVLSSNEQLRSAGREVAEQDIERCVRAADRIRDADDDTAVSVAVGVATLLAYFAAVTFDRTESEAIEERVEAPLLTTPGSRTEDESCESSICDEAGYRRVIEACLEEKGYRTLIWR